MNTIELIEKRCKQYGNFCSSFNGYTVKINPSPWNNYCVSWYYGDTIIECENGITAEQAAKHIEELEWFAEWFPKYGLHRNRV